MREVALADCVLNRSTVASVGERREMDEVVYLRVIQRRQVCGLHIKRFLRNALREDLHICIPEFQIDEVQRREDRRELLGEEFAVLLADAEYRHITDVAEDGIARLLVDLREELVRHRERELILARLRENARNGVGGDVLELIYIKVEWRIRCARVIGARERRHEELAHDDEAEQVRVLLAEAALGEINEKDLLRVHHLAELERGLLLADDGADEVVRGEVVEFVGDVGNDVLQRRFSSRFCSYLVPELVHDGVHALRELLAAELAVGEHARDVQNG